VITPVAKAVICKTGRNIERKPKCFQAHGLAPLDTLKELKNLCAKKTEYHAMEGMAS